MITSATYSSNGAPIPYYLTHDPNTKQKLVAFFPGSGVGYAAYSALAGHFQKDGYATLGFDPRHVRDVRLLTPKDQSLEANRQDVLGILQKLGTTPDICIGHSRGFMHAVRVANSLEQRPEAIIGLCAMGNIQGIMSKNKLRLLEKITYLDAFISLFHAARRHSAGLPIPQAYNLAEYYKRGPSKRADDIEYLLTAPDIDPVINFTYAREIGRVHNTWNVTEDLRTLGQRTNFFLVDGNKDSLIQQTEGKSVTSISDYIDPSRYTYEVLANFGHSMPIRRPREVYSVLKKWMLEVNNTQHGSDAKHVSVARSICEVADKGEIALVSS